MTEFQQINMQLSGSKQVVGQYDFARVKAEEPTAQWVVQFSDLLQQDGARVNSPFAIAGRTYFVSASFRDGSGDAHFLQDAWPDAGQLLAACSLFLTGPDEFYPRVVQEVLELYAGAKAPQPTAQLGTLTYPVAILLPAFGADDPRPISQLTALHRALAASFFRSIGAI